MGVGGWLVRGVEGALACASRGRQLSEGDVVLERRFFGR